MVVPGNGWTGTEMSTDSLNPLPGTDPNKPPLALALQFAAKGDKVVATIYTVPPASDPLRWSDGHKQLLGTHSARVNETMELTELKKIGYEPYSLKIVKAVPPDKARPTLTSKVPSIEISLDDGDDMESRMAAAGDGRSCAVVLRNVSSHGVLAYVLDEGGDPQSGTAWSTGSRSSFGKALIAPGAVHRQIVSFGRSVETTSQSDANLPAQQQKLIVAAAIFNDGSHEGDDDVAAKLEGEQIGDLTVYRLVTPIIDRIVGDQAMNDEARMDRIKEEIYRLSTQPDQATVLALQSQFPSLPPDVLVKSLTRGIDSARNSIWSDLYGYMHNCCQYPPPDHISLSAWWQHTRQLIEPLLAQSR
jgi:hypothetical protein